MFSPVRTCSAAEGKEENVVLRRCFCPLRRIPTLGSAAKRCSQSREAWDRKPDLETSGFVSVAVGFGTWEYCRQKQCQARDWGHVPDHGNFRNVYNRRQGGASITSFGFFRLMPLPLHLSGLVYLSFVYSNHVIDTPLNMNGKYGEKKFAHYVSKHGKHPPLIFTRL